MLELVIMGEFEILQYINPMEIKLFDGFRECISSHEDKTDPRRQFTASLWQTIFKNIRRVHDLDSLLAVTNGGCC